MFLGQLLDEVRAGLIQVPRWQRPFVWTWEQRRDLLRSIRDGIPMGAIMVWRSESVDIACYNSLGPYPLAQRKGYQHQYLLDGVQRLSTLLGALSKPDPNASYPEPD